MTKYISMLRGINVAGQKKVKMADLKLLYQSLGFENVITYIQSGNVIFESNNADILKLKSQIENKIKKEHDFFVPVEIRTREELESIMKNSPFDLVKAERDGKRYLVTFLSDIPDDKSKINSIQEFIAPDETLTLRNRAVYIFCPNGYGKSKLSNNFLERKLDVSATTRNWKTVSMLFELSK